jgi:WD40 repeat protein/tRNA A-37 threonylcarbamoyl transferase component Bud32
MKICPQCESGYHDSLTECPIHGGLLSEIRDLRPGMLIRGNYRIIEKLGKGGMGAVYLAQHTLMNEPRALKFLSQDLSEDEEFTRRFLREVRTLRKIRNRHVVDCGDPERAEDGSLFFSMEYVNGPNLRSFLKTAPRPFDVKLALEITRGIAEGLGAAHAKGMVHRDIKPDNILMARDGEHWVPKIADFGIVATKDSGHHTRTGNMLLTMAYAAPEQWNGTRAADLDGRTDLYALGGLLFDMLTGQPVFDAENYHEWAQNHINTPPRAPSSLRPELARWKGLDALVLRLLAKDRKDRPQGVPAVLALLDAIVYVPSIPAAADPNAAVILNQPPKLQEPAQQPSPVAVRHEPETPLPPPAQTPQPAEHPPIAPALNDLPSAVAGPPPVAPSPTPVENRARDASRQLVSSTDTDPIGKLTSGLSGWVWVLAIVILAGLGYSALRFRAPKVKFVSLQSQSQPILSIAFSANGQTLASASHDNSIQFWDVNTGKALNDVPDHVDALTFSPRGNILATAEWDRDVKQWDVASGQVLDTFVGHTAKVNCVAFSPNGRILASGSSDKTVRLWDLSAEEVVRILGGHGADVNSVAFSPDGSTLASGSADSTIKLWDASSGKLLRTLQGHARAVNSVTFSPDGRTLASGSDDATIIFWDARTGRITRTLTGHTGPVRSVAFSPNGSTLASGSDDSTVKLWHVTGALAAFSTLQGQSAAINSVAFNQDGSIIASGSADNSVRLWYMSTIRN